MSASEAIAGFKSLLAQCEPELRWQGRILSIKTSSMVSFQALRQLENDHFIFQLATDELNTDYVRGRSGDLPPGSAIEIEVPQQASRLAVIPNLRCLLECPGVVTGQLIAYVICDNGVFFSYCSEEPAAIASLPANNRRFHEALSLWKLLQNWSDHVQDDGTILYFGLRRIAIDPGFSEVELPDDTNAIIEIEAFKDTQDRSDIRKEIFKTVLAEQLRDQNPDRAFACILKTTCVFARRLKESLAIYLSEHSPVRLQQEAEKRALEFSEKLEKLISGLELKSLTIAPALLVAFKESLPGQGAVPLNAVTFFAALIYGVSMTWGHHSQLSLMGQIKFVTEDYRDEVKNQGLSESNRALQKVFPDLLNRLKHALLASWVVCYLSWLPTCVVLKFAFFGSVTVEAQPKESKSNMKEYLSDPHAMKP